MIRVLVTNWIYDFSSNGDDTPGKSYSLDPDEAGYRCRYTRVYFSVHNRHKGML